ncbi:serine hydrolase [Streptomyces sp. ME02-8801-2C]|uniref:serine hydrolase n=1 Tax=Streptomyces sp. ME02-8801-2C TaxID=3028680 RepID=UPI0029A986F3|nr:serine hydrolase [Streptomyces sp. ME02-8801-2C]MDX3455008.1 serine hydrolase [Streptomyces sp. ME02-8801-2C]
MASERVPRRRSVVLVVAASAIVMGGTGAATAYVKAQAHTAVGRVTSAAAAPVRAEASEEASVEPVVQPTVEPDTLLSEAMKPVIAAAEDGAEVSVAVLDVESGDHATYGDGQFDTASIVKVDILATLLLQAQDEDRGLTAREKQYATSMIEVSDNASASALWTAIGRAAGLGAANKRFGLTDTEGGSGALWGLTQTTAADQLTLLQQVFATSGADSVLSGASRTYLQGLMSTIAEDQDWGVSAAAAGGASGGRFALKNGWLPRTATGLWDINSIGRVTAADGREFLVAVVSNGNTTKAKGVSLVESAARAAVSALTTKSGTAGSS